MERNLVDLLSDEVYKLREVSGERQVRQVTMSHAALAKVRGTALQTWYKCPSSWVAYIGKAHQYVMNFIPEPPVVLLDHLSQIATYMDNQGGCTSRFLT